MLHYKSIQEYNNSVGHKLCLTEKTRKKPLQNAQTKTKSINQFKKATRAKNAQVQTKSKYSNKKTIVNGITFDSKKEANYYCKLLNREKAGEILNIELQPVFILQEKYRHNGKGIRAIEYRADFSFIENGKKIIVDTKGFRTEIYRIKKKMLLFKYPDINFFEI
jgi:hypothetical protein